MDKTVPIEDTVGAMSELAAYLEENAAAVDVELTDADLDAIASAVPTDAVAGDRYADMSSIDG